MDWVKNALELDAETTCQQITQFIKSQLHRLGRDGIVIGVSGGLDSAIAAYLSVKSVGTERVTLLYMPDKDSKARHRQDAKLVAQELGVDLQVKDITPILDTIGVYDLLPLRYLPGRGLKEGIVKLRKIWSNQGNGKNWLSERMRPSPNSLVARGNAYACIKHRLRMVLLYHQAEIFNLMVVGAANKTELLTGAFSKWGCDQCADVMPLIHLYRSQLPAIAAYLGIPDGIRNKPADPDLIPGIDDKEEVVGSFSQVDHILWGLENDIPLEAIYRDFGKEEVERVASLRENSRHMRESPYIIE